MTSEPSEWHSFGDPPEREGPPNPAAGTNTAPPRPSSSAGPQPLSGAAPQPLPSAAPRPLSSAASHRSAWLAVGLTIIAAVVGVAVFLTTIAVAGGGHADDVVIAARNEATVGGTESASAPQTSDPGAASLIPGGAPGVLVVDVEGAVRSPGLHQIAAGSRIGDAIRAAGGYADRADLVAAALALNLAEPLADGAKIRVPLLGETYSPIIGSGAGQAPEPANNTTELGSGLIDINHADEAALESLPGIGPVTAGKIISTRASGPFASLDDVVGRKALSESVMDKIRALVTVTP